MADAAASSSGQPPQGQAPHGPRNGQEIHTYDAPWPVYAMGWSAKAEHPFRCAIGSFNEDHSNAVEVIELAPPPPDSGNSGSSASSGVKGEEIGEDWRGAAGAAGGGMAGYGGTSAAPSAAENAAFNRPQFRRTASLSHTYPVTKLLWSPDRSTGSPDLFATSGDFLRVWDVQGSGGDDGAPLSSGHVGMTQGGGMGGAVAGAGAGATSSMQGVRSACCLSSNKSAEYCAPLTSFDWNEADPTILGTASIDTTCTIWNVETQQATTQLIAHDKEVYDIAFARGTDVFASVGADGSCRMFDLRSLDHSTIIYESMFLTPLLRLCWNKQDANYLATLVLDSNKVILIDIRVPSLPAAELSCHTGSVNALAWAPHSSCHIASGSDDRQAFVWDLSAVPGPIEDPILSYEAPGEVSNLQWSAHHTDWISIASNDKFQLLRV
jgi:DDB1- and CUL4-associated factor 7